MATVHVVPAHDQIHHHVPVAGGLTPWTQAAHPHQWLTIALHHGEDDEHTCPCGPHTEMVPNPHGPDGWLITHHSLDAREHHE